MIILRRIKGCQKWKKKKNNNNSVTNFFSNPTDSLKRFQNCKNGNEDGGHHLWKLPKTNNVLASKRWNAFTRISFSNKLYSSFIKNKCTIIIVSNFNLYCINFLLFTTKQFQWEVHSNLDITNKSIGPFLFTILNNSLYQM